MTERERRSWVEVIYRRHLNQSCMIVAVQEGVKELYELEVLSYNKVPGLLAVETEVTNGDLRFWYDITRRQSLADCLERKLADFALISQLLGGLERICETLGNYLLTEESILLNPEHIYFDFEQQHVEFVYLPGVQEDILVSYQMLLEFILQRLNHEDKQAVKVLYDMYQEAIQGKNSVSVMIKQAVETMKEEAPGMPEAVADEDENWNEPFEKATYVEKITHSEKATCFEKKYYSEKATGPEKTSWVQKPQGLDWLKQKFGKGQKEEEAVAYVVQEQPVLYPTEILHVGNKVRGVLLYQGDGDCPDIKIDKPVFLIGKKEEEVDAYIEMNSISRIHAKIEQEEDTFYIEDMNSTNGTFLNGEQLEFRQRVQLKSRDRITFGLAEYIFT